MKKRIPLVAFMIFTLVSLGLTTVPAYADHDPEDNWMEFFWDFGVDLGVPIEPDTSYGFDDSDGSSNADYDINDNESTGVLECTTEGICTIILPNFIDELNSKIIEIYVEFDGTPPTLTEANVSAICYDSTDDEITDDGIVLYVGDAEEFNVLEIGISCSPNPDWEEITIDFGSSFEDIIAVYVETESFSVFSFTATIFGSAFIQGGPATLYSINAATGAPTAIGDGIGYDRVGAIDFSPENGLLYGIGKCVSDESDCPEDEDGNNVLITIDTTTGVGTFVTGFFDSEEVPYDTERSPDISFRADGVLFVNLDGDLVTIDPDTGEVSIIGLDEDGVEIFNSGNGMSFASPTLYHADEFDLSVIDQISGEDISSVDLDFITFPDVEADRRINAMDKDDSSGIMFVAVNLGTGQGAGHLNHLGFVDLSTGFVSNIGESIEGLDGLAIQSETITVGGTFVPIDQSALLLAGAQSISMWMIPVVIAGIGIGVFVIKRRN